MNIEIKWVPYHSWFRIRAGNSLIDIDPTLYKAHQKAAEEFKEKSSLLLITHDHFDHCDTRTIEQLRTMETFVIAPENCQTKIPGQMTTIKAGQTVNYGDITIEAVEAYNPGKSYHPKGSGVGYILNISGKRIYHAGDTGYIPEMAELGNIDLALLPTGGTYTMDIEDARMAIKAIKPRIIIPMHILDHKATEISRLLSVQEFSKVVIPEPGATFKLE